MRRPLLSGVALCASLGLALTACDTDTDGSALSEVPEGTATELVQQAYEAIRDESFAVDLTARVGGMEINGEGEADLSQQVGSVAMQYFGQDVEVRVVDDQMYVQDLTGEPGTWIRIDKSDGLAHDPTHAAGDPMAALEYLLSVTDAEKVADGQYEGTVDVEQFLTEHAEAAGEEVPSDLPEGLREVPFEAALDDQGRLTQLTTTFQFAHPDSGETMAVEQELQLSDFGRSVQVEAPPADQIREAPADGDFFEGQRD